MTSDTPATPLRRQRRCEPRWPIGRGSAGNPRRAMSAFVARSSRAAMAASRTPRAMASAWRRSMPTWPACAITERGSLCAAARTHSTHSRRRHLPSPPGPPCQDRASCRSTPCLRDGRRHSRAAHRVALQALALPAPAVRIPPPSPVGTYMRRDAAAELPVTVTPLDSSAERHDPHRRRARRHPGQVEKSLAA